MVTLYHISVEKGRYDGAHWCARGNGKKGKGKMAKGKKGKGKKGRSNKVRINKAREIRAGGKKKKGNKGIGNKGGLKRVRVIRAGHKIVGRLKRSSEPYWKGGKALRLKSRALPATRGCISSKRQTGGCGSECLDALYSTWTSD